MTNELKELMQEINRKFVEQRESYERKLDFMKTRLNEIEKQLLSKHNQTLQLMDENEKLRRLVKNSSEQQKSSTEKQFSNVQTMTKNWNSILEDELRERLEAFVELCREASTDDKLLADIFPPTKNQRFLSPTSDKGEKLWDSVKETAQAPCRTVDFPRSPSFSDPEGVEQLEESLARRYDELASDAAKLLNKNNTNNKEERSNSDNSS